MIIDDVLGSNSRGHSPVSWRWRIGSGLVVCTVLLWTPEPVYTAVGHFVVGQWRTLLTSLFIVGLVCIAGSTVLARHRPARQSHSSHDTSKPLLREIPGWAIWAGMAGLLMVGVLATWWLVSRYGGGDPTMLEQNRIKLEAIKLAGSVVVGTGGAAALFLAARRQRVSELDLLHRDRIAEANRHDADERRATELYTAAAEQLASDKAPVRMAGMYALSRLGETNENLRQTIVNLFCAYLRMPDISIDESASPPDDTREHQEDRGTVQRLENSSQAIVLDLAAAPLAALTALAPDLSAQQQQERQVRLTAQRLLAQHLQPVRGEDGKPTATSFWPDMDIDLTGASLHLWNFAKCEAQSAVFNRARFHKFTQFDGAKFEESAAFVQAQFHGFVLFDDTQFHEITSFSKAQFHDEARFVSTQFHNIAWFDNAQFQDAASFGQARFYDGSRFHHARFHDNASFSEAQFHGISRFDDANFHGDARFVKAQFHDMAWFDTASFDTQANFTHVQARLNLLGQRESTWPTGWTVHESDCKESREDRWGQLSPDKTSDSHSPEKGPQG